MTLHRPFREYHPAIKALVFMLPISLTVFVHQFFIEEPPDIRYLLKDYYKNGASNWEGIFQFVVKAPLVEELMFRGPAWLTLLLTLFLSKKFPHKAVKITGYALTALVLVLPTLYWASRHGHYPITVFGYGLVWGWLMLKTRNILYPIIFHSASNAFAMLFIFSGYHLIY